MSLLVPLRNHMRVRLVCVPLRNHMRVHLVCVPLRNLMCVPCVCAERIRYAFQSINTFALLQAKAWRTEPRLRRYGGGCVALLDGTLEHSRVF